MSEEATKVEAASTKGGLPLKTILAVALLMLVEAGGVVGVMMFLGGPSPVHGGELGLQGNSDPGDDLVEIPVLNERFVNNKEGRLWVWDTELLIVTKQRYQEEVETKLAKHEAKIRTGIGAIWSDARHADFNEPGRVTLTNQVVQYLRSGVFKKPNTEDEERIEDVLIPKCMGFPSDY